MKKLVNMFRKDGCLPMSQGIKLTIQEFALKAERSITKRERERVKNVQIVIDGNSKEVSVLLFDDKSSFVTLIYDWYGRRK